jgi:hypothetical protein
MSETTTGFPSPENEDNPLTQGHGVDPTLQTSNEHTLEILDPAIRQKIDGYLTSNRPGNTIKLEQDTTLEEQCDSNYQYLQEKGIPMEQYIGVLQAAAAECKRLGDAGEGYITRTDGRMETVEYGETLSGEQHPLTGETMPSVYNIFAVDPIDKSEPREAALSMYTGFTDLEVEMAGLGIFSEKEDELLRASCRAEEILERLKATETGQAILQAQGVSQNSEA